AALGGATVGDSHPHHPCPDRPTTFLWQLKVETGSVRQLTMSAITSRRWW
ncbi:hypothetical protein A2U01_0079566, partial [Trifolium medium]|nr:hypothetical protein [Trifolium medium]